MAWTVLIMQWVKGTLYLDPGSGSILLQLLIGALMGSLLAVKIYWKKIKAFFNKGNPQSTETIDSIEDSSTLNDEK